MIKKKIIDIESPDFLKLLSNEELEKLSRDIREFLINNISKTGWHFSSNLWIVELSISLSKEFSFPIDKIIFDVWHQSYVYKILTWRAEGFIQNFRKHDWISWFQRIEEWVYDQYEAWHSSTSISAAIWFAVARDLDKKEHYVVSVIWDASISNWIAFEALNNLEEVKSSKFIIVLNDNWMSISPNVWWVNKILDNIKKNIDREKNVNFFESLWLKYIWVIDWHNFEELENWIKKAKKENWPVLLHVLTQKWKWYKYSEEDIIWKWHWVWKFDINSGVMEKKAEKLVFWKLVSDSMIELSEKDKDIVIINPAMKIWTQQEEYFQKFKNRYFDVWISEEHAFVFANALALSWKKPFISIYSTFLQRWYDQISHDIARMSSNVVIWIESAWLSPEYWDTHHWIYDVSLLSGIPNIIIAAPYDEEQLKNLLYTALNYNWPFVLRYAKTSFFDKNVYLKNDYKKLEIWKWEQLKKWEDLTIISYGNFLYNSIQIREKLLNNWLMAEVVNALFIKPFDEEYFDIILSKNKLIVVYEEVEKTGSLWQMLCSYAMERWFSNRIICLSIDKWFVWHWSLEELLKILNLDVERAYKRILKELKDK